MRVYVFSPWRYHPSLIIQNRTTLIPKPWALVRHCIEPLTGSISTPYLSLSLLVPDHALSRTTSLLSPSRQVSLLCSRLDGPVAAPLWSLGNETAAAPVLHGVCVLAVSIMFFPPTSSLSGFHLSQFFISSLLHTTCLDQGDIVCA